MQAASAAALPAVVAPEPVWGIATDGAFEHAQVFYGEGILFALQPGGGEDWAEGEVVIAAAPGLDIDIDEVGTHFAADDFAAVDIGCVDTHEVCPVLEFGGEGALVCDEAADEVLSLTLEAEQIAHGAGHRDVEGAEAAAQVEHQAVKHLVAKRMIHLAHHRPWLDMAGHGGDPLPVAVVPEQEYHRAAVAQGGVDELHPFDCDASGHLPVRYMSQLGCLYKHIAQM